MRPRHALGSVFTPLALICAALAPVGAVHADIAYLNLPPISPFPGGYASSGELADDLILDLAGSTLVQSATLRIIGSDVASGSTNIRLSLYTDNAGQPGTLLTTVALTIPRGGPAAFDQLFDFPDFTLSSPNIWAGIRFGTFPGTPSYVGAGTLPTIGSTTARAANRLSSSTWNVNGALGPPDGGGIYIGDRLQIAINTVPTPGAAAFTFLALALCAPRRRAQTARPLSARPA